MRVLVGCEFSGMVRDAFIARGHEAMSCDILPSERPGPHYQGDIRDVLGDGWDLAIFHPPCTHLAVSGARWWREKFYDQEQAIAFVRMLMVCGIPRIAIENPISLISSRIRKPDQIIQPWMFGHGETKKTCLWLKNLPPLWPTNIAPGNEARVWKMPPGENRWRERSRTYPGIAEAMAEQWGGLDTMSAPRPRRTKMAATPTLPPTPTPTTTTATATSPIVAFRVDGKPVSVNRMYGTTRNGHKYVTSEAKAWQGMVWAAAYAARMGIPHPARARYPIIFSTEERYRVVCTFYGMRATSDADNLLKLTLDGIKTGLRIDDRYFTSVEAHKSSDRSQRQGALIEVYAAAA